MKLDVKNTRISMAWKRTFTSIFVNKYMAQPYKYYIIYCITKKHELCTLHITDFQI